MGRKRRNADSLQLQMERFTFHNSSQTTQTPILILARLNLDQTRQNRIRGLVLVESQSAPVSFIILVLLWVMFLLQLCCAAADSPHYYWMSGMDEAFLLVRCHQHTGKRYCLGVCRIFIYNYRFFFSYHRYKLIDKTICTISKAQNSEILNGDAGSLEG